MKWVWHRLAAAALCSIAGAAAVADYQSALEAAQRGDYNSAFPAFLEEALKGDPRAQAHLGDMFRRGLGTAASARDAVKWYRKAAAQGDRAAQYNLGVHYREGAGVAPDPTRASQWFRAAARQGHSLAQLNLGVRYLSGEGVPRDPVLAYAWMTRAALGGNALAKRHRQRFASALTISQKAQGEALARTPLRKPTISPSPPRAAD